MKTPPHIGYVIVNVSDLSRSVEFFEQTLGLRLEFSDSEFGYASFEAGPVKLGVAQVDPAAEESAHMVGRHTGIGFAVPDLVKAHEALVEQGVIFPMKPSKQPWGGFMATFLDPDQNLFYLDQIEAEQEKSG